MLDRRLVEVVSRAFKLHPDAIHSQTSSEDILGWDSVGHLNLILEIEGSFVVRFLTEEIPLLSSLGRIQEALKRHGAL